MGRVLLDITGRLFLVPAGIRGFREHGWQVSPSPAGHSTGGKTWALPIGRGEDKNRHQPRPTQLTPLFISQLFLNMELL